MSTTVYGASAFNKADVNDDSVIDEQESGYFSDEDVSDMDDNGDGKVTYDEYEHEMNSRKNEQKGVEHSKPEDVDFKTVDYNGDGKISEEEWNAAGLDNEEYAKYAGDDGEISTEEYETARSGGTEGAKGAENNSPEDTEGTGETEGGKGSENVSPQDVNYTSVDANGDGIDQSEWDAAGLDPKKFAEYDANGDGKVSSDEYEAGLAEDNKAKGAEHISPLDASYGSVDTDGNGIDKNEWNAAGLDDEKFDKYDTDNNGVIDEDEYSDARKQEVEEGNNAKGAQHTSPTDIDYGSVDRNGDGIDENEWNQAGLDPKKFEQYDADGDGKVSSDEYRQGRIEDNKAKGAEHNSPLDVGYGSVDTDGNGIDKNEWNAAGLDDEKFDKYDTDNNGVIDEDEYSDARKQEVEEGNNAKGAQHTSPTDIDYGSVDRNGDGIDENEWNQAGLDPKKFAEYDANGDGKVSSDEYRQGRIEDNKAKGAEHNRPQDTSFNEVDSDGDGVVTEDEWNAAGLDPVLYEQYSGGDGMERNEYEEIIHDQGVGYNPDHNGEAGGAEGYDEDTEAAEKAFEQNMGQLLWDNLMRNKPAEEEEAQEEVTQDTRK